MRVFLSLTWFSIYSGTISFRKGETSMKQTLYYGIKLSSNRADYKALHDKGMEEK